MAAKKTTIHDVAREADVNYSTVSLALRGDQRIRSYTRQRIQTAAHRLGYVPNQLARSLSRGATHTIGVMLTDIHRGFTDPLEEFQDIADRARYMISVHFSSWDQARERAGLRHFCESRVEGVIWAPAQWYGETFAQTVENMKATGVPVVMLGLQRPPYDVPFHQVGTSLRDRLTMALDYLMGLGHRHIGLASAPAPAGTEASTAPERQADHGAHHSRRYFSQPEGIAMVRQAMQARGLALAEQDLFTTADNDYGGVEIAVHLFRRPREHWPTAVIAADDRLGRALTKGLWALGVKVPEEISVLGFDVPSAETGQPPLTAVSQDSRRMGTFAMDLLLQLIKQQIPHQPQKITVMPPRLVEAGTCGPPRK